MTRNNKIQSAPKFIDKSDQILIWFSLICFTISFYHLKKIKVTESPYRDLTPIATVSNYLNNVKRKTTGSLSWHRIQKESAIFQGDLLFTDNESSTSITFTDDSSTLEISENSLVKIEAKNKDYDINLLNGFININFSKNKNKFNLIYQKKKYQIKGEEKSNILIAKTSKGISLSSQSKNIKIKSNQKTFQINSDQDIMINESVKIKENNILILGIENNQKIMFNDQNSLNIKWKSKSKKSSQILISKSPTFTNLLIKNKLNKTKSFKVKDFLPGKYFFKIIQEKNQSKTLSFTIEAIEAPNFKELQAPKKIAVKRNHPIQINLNLKKSKEYVFCFTTPSSLEKCRILKKKTISIKTNKNISQLTWKIRFNLKHSNWTKDFTSQIEYINDLALLSPREKIVFYPNKDDNVATFRWNGLAHERFHFSIKSEQNNFHFKKDIKGSKTNVSIRKKGPYLISIQLKNNPNVKIENKRIEIYHHAASLNQSQKSPKKIKLSYKKDFKGLKWTALNDKNIQSFDFTLTGKKIKHQETKKRNDNIFNFPFKKPGDYTLKITAKQTEIDKYILPTQIKLKIILPKKLSINKKIETTFLRNEDSIEKLFSFNVPEIKYAKKYHVIISKERRKSKTIVNKTYNSNKIIWNTSKFKYEKAGTYYFKYRVIDQWGRASRYSKTSEVIFPISPLK